MSHAIFVGNAVYEGGFTKKVTAYETAVRYKKHGKINSFRIGKEDSPSKKDMKVS